MKQHARPFAGSIDHSWRIGIIHSSFYKEEVEVMVEGAKKVLLEAGFSPSNIRTFPVPGSFEIPLIGSALAEAKEVDALIGLGIIVEGETHHARLIAEAAAHGAMEVQVRRHIPFVFEILYVDDIALARERLDKGAAAAHAALQSLALLRHIHS